jgi:hypothetical protein
VPSLEQLANSDSFTGLKITFSIPDEWPRSSVEYLTWGRSGFQIRSVRSAEPVAIKRPVGFQARVRMLGERSNQRSQQNICIWQTQKKIKAIYARRNM